MDFKVFGAIRDTAVIASGTGVIIRSYLRKAYGQGRWRKLKAVAVARLRNGNKRLVELHWYEAHGIGKRDIKIKRYLTSL